MKNKKDLIAQISQNLAVTPTPVAETSKTNASKAVPTARAQRATRKQSMPQGSAEIDEPDPPRATGSGKQAAFWLDDEDRAIFHETGMLLYSQGIKPSHNLVLRAAIRMIPRDHRLVEKVRELIEKDGRKVRHQKK